MKYTITLNNLRKENVLKGMRLKLATAIDPRTQKTASTDMRF